MDRDTACADTVARRCYHPQQCRFHKNEKAEQLVKARLPKRAASSFDISAQAIGDIIALFSVSECRNFFKAAGYEAE